MKRKKFGDENGNTSWGRTRTGDQCAKDSSPGLTYGKSGHLIEFALGNFLWISQWHPEIGNWVNPYNKQDLWWIYSTLFYHWMGLSTDLELWCPLCRWPRINMHVVYGVSQYQNDIKLPILQVWIIWYIRLYTIYRDIRRAWFFWVFNPQLVGYFPWISIELLELRSGFA